MTDQIISDDDFSSVPGQMITRSDKLPALTASLNPTSYISSSPERVFNDGAEETPTMNQNSISLH